MNIIIPKGSSIQLYLEQTAISLSIIPDYSTFDLISYTDSTFTYKIDQLLRGLNPTCNTPCKECSAGNPNSCLSCFPTSL